MQIRTKMGLTISYNLVLKLAHFLVPTSSSKLVLLEYSEQSVPVCMHAAARRGRAHGNFHTYCWGPFPTILHTTIDVTLPPSHHPCTELMLPPSKCKRGKYPRPHTSQQENCKIIPRYQCHPSFLNKALAMIFYKYGIHSWLVYSQLLFGIQWQYLLNLYYSHTMIYFAFIP